MAVLTDPAIPSSRTGQVLVGTIGTDDTPDDFLIKAEQISIRLRNPNREHTGDGDAQPKFNPSNYMYLNFVIDGIMLVGAVFNIANLIDTTNNPLSANLQIFFSSAQILSIPEALIEDIQIQWFKRAEAIRIRMVGVNTGSVPTWAAS